MKKSVVIWIHVGFCCIILLFYYLLPLIRWMDIQKIGSSAMLFVYAIFVPVVFYVSYFLIGSVLKNKKNIAYVFLFYLIAFFFPEVAKPLFRFIHNYSNGTLKFSEPQIGLNLYFLITTIKTSFWGGLFYLGIDWYRKKEQKKELERQNLQSELKLLKSQINPHFLFNTLNNIDRLIVSNPDKASSMLVGLSGMMRYMIYDTNANISPLSLELQQIRNYIDLQLMQYANSDLAAYTVEGDQEGLEVAPMLFIPFIENAFKHCTDKTVKQAIRISFRIEDKRLFFESVNIANPSQHIEKDSTGGIGLETVKRRLDLLYPDKHKLQIDEKNDLFSVFLSIDL